MERMPGPTAAPITFFPPESRESRLPANFFPSMLFHWLFKKCGRRVKLLARA